LSYGTSAESLYFRRAHPELMLELGVVELLESREGESQQL
jgi:hypothetical protein